MYRSIIKPILFSLTIERAHRAVLILLRAIGLIPGGRWLLRKCYAVEHPALEREVFGIKFANPVGLAAGFDRNGEAFRELAALGFGLVEVGTVTPANNAAADYLKLFRNLYQYADYFTVNISCDNSCREGATHTRAHILRILDPLFDFRRGQNQYRPIMLKVSPDMPDAVIDEISDILLETPLDGIVATNGTHNREGLHTSRTTLDKIGSGRLSGAPLTQRAVEVVRRIHTRSGGNFPIIGVGGIMTPDDAKAMLDAGADLLQLYTGYIYNGPGLVRDICRALVADAEAKAAAERAATERAATERAAAERAAAEKTTAKPAAQQLPAKHTPQPAATAPAPENAENAEPAPAESRTPAQSGPDSEQPES